MTVRTRTVAPPPGWPTAALLAVLLLAAGVVAVGSRSTDGVRPATVLAARAASATTAPDGSTGVIFEVVPHPSGSPTPDPTAQPTPDPGPTTQPAPDPDPTAQPTPDPGPTTQPAPDPDPTAQPTPDPGPTTQPAPDPDPTGQPLPVTGPDPGPGPLLAAAALLIAVGTALAALGRRRRGLR
ncbi:hypothetical protein [Micromonospora fluostatini]|uniref:hypothetical protein n=1 Tax=Micromonospora sp. JCM 30529 TaxID=3421643 RepID=UPI003D16B3B8